MRPILLPSPPLAAIERERVRSGLLPAVPGRWQSAAYVARGPMQGPLRRMLRDAPVWDAGANGDHFVPSFVRQYVGFWHDIIIQNHLLRGTLVSYLREGVGPHDLLLEEYGGPSIDCPYVVGRLPGVVFTNSVPPAFPSCVEAEVQSIVDRGYVAKWTHVRGPEGPRPRLVMALSFEETKPCLLCQAKPLSKWCKRIPFSMNTVARVSNVVSPGCFVTSQDDFSVFHQVFLRSSSWLLFGFSNGVIDYYW